MHYQSIIIFLNSNKEWKRKKDNKDSIKWIALFLVLQNVEGLLKDYLNPEKIWK